MSRAAVRGKSDAGIDNAALARACEIEPLAHIVWQVKVSTLCNLRCRYCYEWDRLSDPTRVTLDQWRRIFEAVAEYQRVRLLRHQVHSRISIMWHGGEPSLLPPSYVRDVIALQREVFVTHGLSNGDVINAVQTNLRRMNSTLETMIKTGFIVNASLDFATGARVDATGRDSDSAVRANLQRLTARAVPCGVTLVLGLHNHQRLPEINDWLEDMGVAWLRVVPMFKPPTGAPGGLALDSEAVVAALTNLFLHRLHRPDRMRVYPLQSALEAVISRSAAIPTQPYGRRNRGESRLIVHPDGTLAAQGGTARPAHVLGNVFAQSVHAIFSSPAYHASLDHDDELRTRHCTECRYQVTCDGRPIISHPHPLAPGPCPIESRLMTAIEKAMQD